MANCEECGTEIFSDEGMVSIGRCKNKDCSKYNIPTTIRR